MRVQLAFVSSCRRIVAADDGASVVEFALFAPILCLALLTAADLGTALSERLSMQHVLRSGSQVAMEDPDYAQPAKSDHTSDAVRVKYVLDSTAARNFPVAQPVPGDLTFTIGDSVELSALRFCACPNAPDTYVDCSTVCPGTLPTFISYRMTASKKFSGILLQGLPLATSTQVQVR